MNLDAMDKSDLTDFCLKIYLNPIKTAREIFPTKPKGYVKATKELGAYSSHKATAMQYRLDGNIPAALIHEHNCDNIYNRLPKYAKW